MEIPEPKTTISNLIDQAHQTRAEKPRPHMGCSSLGHHCERWLWLSFRWAVVEQFQGRILRLFRRGQNEEATIISDLRAIGMHVSGTQRRVNFGSHVSGSLDGTATGVPGAPRTEHVLEFKTHSLKSFNDLEKNGVGKSKPQHATQCQVYMHGTDLNRALYVAVCKDDDRIYTERIEYDKDHAEKAIAKGQRLALADRLPPPISTDSTWFECKFCAAHDFCHGSKTTKQINCRTCAHSTPTPESTWHCARWDSNIPTDDQHDGCESHVIHPDLVPWKRLEGPSDWIAVYEIEGFAISNGEPSDGVYSSRELIANPKACASGDAQLNALREEWNGRIC